MSGYIFTGDFEGKRVELNQGDLRIGEAVSRDNAETTRARAEVQYPGHIGRQPRRQAFEQQRSYG